MEIQNAGALGTGDIVFNGGALKYGTGITTDISGQLKTDALASNAILVDTNGNAVTWPPWRDGPERSPVREKAA